MAKKQPDKPRKTRSKTGNSSKQSKAAPPEQPSRARERLVLRLLLVLIVVVLAWSVLAGDMWPFGGGSERVAEQRIDDPYAPLAKFYTPEVLHWSSEIYAWAERYQINPNVIAILMQIESCGSSEVLSWVGATGLMQVMPYYFDDGENMLNPDTNVRHAMRIFQECLNVFAEGHLGVAAACYNGGASVTQTAYSNWPTETQHYYDWATGLWNDVVRGVSSSDTLQDWLDSGGSRLCAIAAEDIFPPVVTAPTLATGNLDGP